MQPECNTISLNVLEIMKIIKIPIFFLSILYCYDLQCPLFTREFTASQNKTVNPYNTKLTSPHQI